MSSSQQLEWEYNKANSLANWSFVAAFIVPIIGMVLASKSMIRLRWLMGVNQNDDTALVLQATHKKAVWGMVLSTIGLLLGTMLFFIIIAASTKDALNTNCTFKTSGDIYNMESTTHCE